MCILCNQILVLVPVLILPLGCCLRCDTWWRVRIGTGQPWHFKLRISWPEQCLPTSWVSTTFPWQVLSLRTHCTSCCMLPWYTHSTAVVMPVVNKVTCTCVGHMVHTMHYAGSHTLLQFTYFAVSGVRSSPCLELLNCVPVEELLTQHWVPLWALLLLAVVLVCILPAFSLPLVFIRSCLALW